jgi:hypothetical protein
VPRVGGSSLHWDILDLFSQVKQGISKAVNCCERGLVSVGLDTWGVDFGLLDAQDELLGNPYHYRDGRTDGMVEEACRRVPREGIFEITGIQFMHSTRYQLAMAVQRFRRRAAETLLMMPDLLNSGRPDARSASTPSQHESAPDAHTCDWARPCRTPGIPAHLPGDRSRNLGPLLPWAGEKPAAGLGRCAGCHDTASAVYARRGENWLSQL